MSKFLDYLNIKKCGLFEFIIALYPILAGYAYGIIHLNDIVLLLLCVIAYKRKKSIRQEKTLKFLSIFLLVHELIVWIGFTSMPLYMINNTLSLVLYLLSISIIANAINYDKYVHSLIIVSFIISVGIVYHFIIIKSGGSVSPIPLPFMPTLPSTSRFFEIGNRPVSFFWEPAGYASYMLIPLMYFMIEKKYIMVAIIIVCMFLSTSSTAILLSLLMGGFYILLSQKSKVGMKFFFATILVGMTYFLLTSDLFSAGVEKIESTDIETTSRLFNGPELFNNMPLLHFVTGIPAANVTDYYFITPYIKNANLLVKEDTIFMPTFYLIIAKYGIPGFILYFLSILKPVLRCRDLWPFVGVMIIAFFFAGNSITPVFVFQMIFIYSYVNNINKINKLKLYERTNQRTSIKHHVIHHC